MGTGIIQVFVASAGGTTPTNEAATAAAGTTKEDVVADSARFSMACGCNAALCRATVLSAIVAADATAFAKREEVAIGEKQAMAALVDCIVVCGMKYRLVVVGGCVQCSVAPKGKSTAAGFGSAINAGDAVAGSAPGCRCGAANGLLCTAAGFARAIAERAGKACCKITGGRGIGAVADAYEVARELHGANADTKGCSR